MTTIAARLIDERKRLGLSQADARDIAVVGRQAYIDYEAGRTFPNAEALSHLAKRGFDVQYIVTGVRAAVLKYEQGEPRALGTRSEELQGYAVLTEREAAVVSEFRAATEKGRAAVEAVLEAVVVLPTDGPGYSTVELSTPKARTSKKSVSGG